MCVLTKRERKETAMDAKLVGERIKNLRQEKRCPSKNSLMP